MRVLRLAIPSSPSKSVVLSAIYREVLVGGLPAEIHVISEGDAGAFDAVRRVFEGLGWAGTGVFLHEVGGIKEWFEALAPVSPDVVDVTPGRKVHALALYTQAVRVGARVRYSYLIDEGRFGYMYPGYAPPWAVRLLELYPGLRAVRYSIPEDLSAGSWEGVADSAIMHSLINTARVAGAELRIASRDLIIRLVTEREPFAVAEASGLYSGPCLNYSSYPANVWEVVRSVAACVRKGCSIALDTSALMLGMNEFLASKVKGYASMVTHLDPVLAEVLAFIESKHSPEGVVRKLAYLDAAAAGQVPTPSSVRGARRGDVEIIKGLESLRGRAPCTCFLTADRNLADAVRIRSLANVILLKHSGGPNLIEESIPKLVRCAALAGRATVSVGRLRARMSAGEVVGGDVSFTLSLNTHGKLAELLWGLVSESRKNV